MNVPVTGGAGHAGSVVTEVLLREQFKVVVVDNLIDGHKDAISEDIPFVKDDIGDRIRIKKVLKGHNIEAVIHIAGETLVSKSMTHSEY